MEIQYSSTVKNLTMMKEIAMKVLTDKSNNLNILTEESSSDNNEEGEQNLIGSKDNKVELCPDCHGSGSLQDNTCGSCNGSGLI